MHVLEAADGPPGSEAARREQPDVILLDVMMPGLDGWRVAEELLEDERTVDPDRLPHRARRAARPRPRPRHRRPRLRDEAVQPDRARAVVRDVPVADRARRDRRAPAREARRAARPRSTGSANALTARAGSRRGRSPRPTSCVGAERLGAPSLRRRALATTGSTIARIPARRRRDVPHRADDQEERHDRPEDDHPEPSGQIGRWCGCQVAEE